VCQNSKLVSLGFNITGRVVLDLFEANRELEGTTSLVVLGLGSKGDLGLVCGRYISGIKPNTALVLNQFCLKSPPARHWYKVSIALGIYYLPAGGCHA